MQTNSIFESMILGAIQGLTEFLPISSSAHLILASNFMGDKPLPLYLNVALHFGTLLAVLVFFYRDWLSIFKKLIEKIKRKKKSFEADILFPCLIIGSIPAGFLGLTFKDSIEEFFHKPSSLVLPLIVIGFLLWLCDNKFSSQKACNKLILSRHLL